MAILLFSLRGVPDDEAFEIKQLLSDHDINYYETSAGNWGISMPAIWLNDPDELEQAQNLLNDYHQQRANYQKELYQKLKKEGKNKNFVDSIKEKPLLCLLYLITAILILYAYGKMLIEFGL